MEPDLVETFARIGNNLSADFVNTVVSFDHDGGTLRSAGDVVDFLATMETISAADAERLRAQVKNRAVAARFLATALELRTAVTSALTAIERRERVDDDSLALVNAILAAGAGFDQLAPHDDAYRLERRHMLDDPGVALVPIARDLAGLLVTPGAPVRKCAGEGCVRHFYDDSRTGRRRWCEMAICGNRAKAATFAKRHAGHRSL
jgi:predicted RNA-binding Zn ribbon-like protein